MTVKELKEVLSACNDDAEIIIADDSGSSNIQESQIYQTSDGSQVVFDPSIGDES